MKLYFCVDISIGEGNKNRNSDQELSAEDGK
jgi:hypothetical protein